MGSNQEFYIDSCLLQTKEKSHRQSWLVKPLLPAFSCLVYDHRYPWYICEIKSKMNCYFLIISDDKN